jgi:hypothetical protein
MKRVTRIYVVDRKTVEAASALGIPVDPHDPLARAKIRLAVKRIMACVEKNRPGTTADLPRLSDES